MRNYSDKDDDLGLVEVHERNGFHASFNSFGSIFLDCSFAWSRLVASLNSLPSFTGSPFHVWSSHVDDFLGFINN